MLGADTAWGLGFAVEPSDGWGMGGLGGSFGWWSEAGRYAIGFVTGHAAPDVTGEDPGDRLENAVREVLGLDPV